MAPHWWRALIIYTCFRLAADRALAEALDIPYTDPAALM